MADKFARYDPPEVLSPAQITADQNDYAPSGWSTSEIVRLDSDASRNITGLAATADRVLKKLINVGSFNIVLGDEDVGSAAANRITVSGGVNLTMQPDDAVDVFYDSTSARWRVV